MSGRQDEAWTRDEIERYFQHVWWTCGSCHQAFPKDYEGDWCNDCNVRLRRNDDIRIALQRAES